MRLLLCLFLVGCSAGEVAAPAASVPVVVIGVDGLDPGVVDALLSAERLPNLARFADEGVMGRLQTMKPTYSPVLWTTIVTGRPPRAHGITHFHDAEERPFTSNARRVPALWNVLSERERRVDCIGWWVTWPAEAINGRMVASYAAQAQANVVWKPGTWENLERQTYPEGLREQIRPRMIFASDADAIRARLWERFPEPSELDDVTRKSVTDLAWTYAADLSYTRIATDFLAQDPAELTLIYLALPDVAGHRFWSAHEPAAFARPLSQQKRDDFGSYVRTAYEEIDRLIGQILAVVPQEAHVLVLSDHGMHAFELALDDPERVETLYADITMIEKIAAALLESPVERME